ncbi:MAG: sarcosine oxidase subunit gamma family protein [Casimicrobiaceae bacterium]
MSERSHIVPGQYGKNPGGVELAAVTIPWAWNIQGRGARGGLPRELARIELPTEPNTMASADGVTAAWLGPGSWLLVGHAPPAVPFAQASAALDAAGAALFEVSASRVAYRIGGPRAVDVLAALCPLDFHPGVFGLGTCAQSVFGHVNALIVRPAGGNAFVVLVACSFGRDVWHGLCATAAEYGYEVQQETAWPAG